MTYKEYKNLFKEITKKVKKKLSKSPACHDWDHTERVLRNSQKICEVENKSDRKVVEIAALLHDIARGSDMYRKKRKCHAAEGAIIAKRILSEYCSNKNFIERVCLCVKRHRFRGDDAPQSLEEKIVYDADKLDSLGAVGIGRAFHFSGRIGSRLHNEESIALNSKSYSNEDTAFREYLVKMRGLPQKMLTKTGKKLALRRAKIMKKFFEELNNEVFGNE